MDYTDYTDYFLNQDFFWVWVVPFSKALILSFDSLICSL